MSLKRLDVAVPTANQEQDTFTVPYKFLRLLSITPATALVTVRMAEPRDQGNHVPFDLTTRVERHESAPPLAKLFVKSDTANTSLAFEVGTDDKLIVETGGVVTGAVNTTPVGPDLMLYQAAGINVPKQSSNGQDLAVGGLLTLPGIYGFGMTFPTKGASFLRLVVQAGNNGDYITAVDGTDIQAPPIILYDERGQIARTDGRIYFNNVVGETYSPAGKVYFADVRGVGSVQFNFGVGTVGVSLAASPLETIPAKRGTRQVILNAADCGVVLGAYPAGVRNILDIATIKPILTRLGIVPTQLRILLHDTPGGADTYQWILGFSQNGIGAMFHQPYSGAVTAVPWIHYLGLAKNGYSSGNQVIHGETFGGFYATQTPAGSGGAAVISGVFPIDDLEFVFRNSTGAFGGVLTDFSLLLEE